MPTRAPAACGYPHCPARAVRRGCCARHDPGAFAGTAPMAAGWARLRTVALTRDHHRCVLCGARGNSVDHIVARHLGGSDALDNLRTLCTAHHAQVTGAQGGRASVKKR
jgi:hypothetical protein